MLVLSRKVGESVVIDGQIVVKFIRHGHNGTIKLGIDAPQQVRVFRQEIQDEIDQKNKLEQQNNQQNNQQTRGEQ